MRGEVLEIRPKARRNAVILAALCAMFTVTGFFMVVTGEAVLAGLIGIAFFGGGAIFAIPKMLGRSVSMKLTPEALLLVYPEGTASIAWRDVEQVGIASIFTNKMAALRLHRYDGYLDSIDPALADAIARRMPYLKLAVRGASILDVPGAVRIWSRLEGHDIDGLQASLKAFGKVGDIAEMLLWNRARTGFDIAFAWAEIDRSAGDFVALLEEYLAEWRRRGE